MNKRIGVIGGGSWATALVKILSENVDSLNWWMKNETSVEYFKKYHRNPNYLSSVFFVGDKINVSADLKLVIDNSDILIMATPSAFLYDVFNEYPKEGLDKKIIFTAVKGVVPEYHAIPVKFFHKQFRTPYNKIGIICGPCHAEEVALERLSYLTIACSDVEKAKIVAKNLSCTYIKAKTSDDIIGTEYAAVLKNIYSIAAGIAHGLGYGDNFQAVLMSNGIREMKRFIKQVHRMKRNINNSAYLGDLLVTGYSVFSRNRMFGNMIGKGYTVKSAMLEMSMVAEGYYAAKSAYKLNQNQGAKTPIIDAVYSILYENKDPKKVFKKLTDKFD